MRAEKEAKRNEEERKERENADQRAREARNKKVAQLNRLLETPRVEVRTSWATARYSICESRSTVHHTWWYVDRWARPTTSCGVPGCSRPSTSWRLSSLVFSPSSPV